MRAVWLWYVSGVFKVIHILNITDDYRVIEDLDNSSVKFKLLPQEWTLRREIAPLLPRSANTFHYRFSSVSCILQRCSLMQSYLFDKGVMR